MKQLKSADPWCEPDIWYPAAHCRDCFAALAMTVQTVVIARSGATKQSRGARRGDHLFGSDHQAQRFLSTQGQINNFFHLRRDHVTAVEHTARCNTGWQMVPAK